MTFGKRDVFYLPPFSFREDDGALVAGIRISKQNVEEIRYFQI